MSDVKNMNKFVNEEVKSDSTKRAYELMFERIINGEVESKKNIEDLSEKSDLFNIIKTCCDGSTYSSVFTKFSLLRKYLNYIGNDNINSISKNDLRELVTNGAKESGKLRYISKSELTELISQLENYSDKCIVMLARNGVGIDFEAEDLINIKESDVDLNNKTIKGSKIDDYTNYLVEKTLEEKEYISMGVYDKIIIYNENSEYLFKTRRVKATNDGVNHFRISGFRGRLQKIRQSVGDDRIILRNLILSYIIDEVIKYENANNIDLNQVELRKFLNNEFNITKNIYDVHYMIKELKNNNLKGEK